MTDIEPSEQKSVSHAGKERPRILCVAGFGDNASMFEGLRGTKLAQMYDLQPFDLPGFGASPLKSRTTLHSLADAVSDQAKATGAQIIIAHSVASIIASLAAKRPACPLTIVISLEGNITAEDAYFSGTAADYSDPHTFRAAFLARLDAMADQTPIIKRYRNSVSKADPLALWQLGVDARRFSSECVPGDVLAASAAIVYFYNPDNCPSATLEWLANHPMDRVVLDQAAHWASVDQPELLAEKNTEALR